MNPAHKKIFVAVNMRQKDFIKIGDTTVKMVPEFELNYRERSPVLGEVVYGNKYLKKGQIIVCHHNHFYPPSPYHVQDNIFSIPFNTSIFGIIDSQGEIMPVCGNIIAERVFIETTLPQPIEQRKTYIDRVRIVNPGWTKYKEGQLLFHRPNAAYDIVYNWNGIEKRITKIPEEQVVGVVE